ncbi:MAG: hypothetical protein ABFS46_14915, partial [Myxococcota bacterium]
LAFFSVFAGFFGLPQIYGDMLGVKDSNSLAHFLTPVVGFHPMESAEHPLFEMAGLAVLASSTGAVLAWLLYARFPGVPRWLQRTLPNLHRVVERKYYVDEIYDALLVRPTVWISEAILYRSIDAGAIDGALVGGAARSVRALAGDVLRYLQSGFAQAYLLLMVLGTLAILGYLSR